MKDSCVDKEQLPREINFVGELEDSSETCKELTEKWSAGNLDERSCLYNSWSLDQNKELQQFYRGKELENWSTGERIGGLKWQLNQK